MLDIHKYIKLPDTEAEATQFALVHQNETALEHRLVQQIYKDVDKWSRLRGLLNVHDRLAEWVENHPLQHLVTEDERYIYFAGVRMYTSKSYLRSRTGKTK